ncbi:MAG: response regulator transcription factor [Desulfotomaculaceae bacterium]|nr:response regulator transcription factor [Desulfotomaculaceae bacterium]
MSTIFVVDDEENIRLLISQYLQKEGYTVETFNSVEELSQRLESSYPDMIILDIMLPGQDGLEFCRELRQRSGVPVIFISARRKALDRIMGLEIGGDDYLSKPFSPRELVARVRSVLRRTLAPSDPQGYLLAGNLKLVPGDRLILINGQELVLTRKEYELLALLIQNPQRTFNRQELLDRIWGYDYNGSERAVDDLIKRLRRKLKESDSETNIQTIWGYGYRLDGEVEKHIY